MKGQLRWWRAAARAIRHGHLRSLTAPSALPPARPIVVSATPLDAVFLPMTFTRARKRCHTPPGAQDRRRRPRDRLEHRSRPTSNSKAMLFARKAPCTNRSHWTLSTARMPSDPWAPL